MRFGLAPEHFEFYYQNDFIEFEDLITEEEATILKEKIDNETVSRDLFRKDPEIKKIILRHKLAEIASNLTKTKPLRFGYDHLFKSGDLPLFKEGLTLDEMSSIQGVVCGFILSITDEPNPLMETGISPIPLLPHKKGAGIFFSKDSPISFKKMFELPNQTHILIVYVKQNAVYQETPNDPMPNFLKTLGYGYGDKLLNDTHPIVFS